MDEVDDDLPARLSHLATSIDVPPGPPVASFTATSASRPWRGRRVLAVAAGIMVMAGIAAVVWAVVGERSTQVTAGPGEMQGPSIDDSTSGGALARILLDDDVDLDRAPPGLLDGEFQVCGRQREVTAQAARCLLDALLAHIPAVMVDSDMSTEGDPIVTVHRTTADGTYDYLVDATRDAFGSGQWEHGTCDTVLSYRPGALSGPLLPFNVDGCGELSRIEEGDVLPSLGPMPEVPDWFGQREPLRLCGVDFSVDDGDPLSRLCFSNAVTAGEPAEFVYVSTGDEGESGVLWYRSLAGGVVEAIERQIPGAGDPAGSTGHWLRYECTSAGIIDEPGFGVNGLPAAHTGPDCSIVDETPG